MNARLGVLVSAALVGLIGTAFSQMKTIEPTTVVLPKDQINLRRINLAANARVQGTIEPPMLFGQSQIWRYGNDGTYAFQFFGEGNFVASFWGDQGMMAGGRNAALTGPAYYGPWNDNVADPNACVYQVDILLFAPAANANAMLEVGLRNYNGTFGSNPFGSQPLLWTSGSLNLGAVAAGDILYVSIPVDADGLGNPLVMGKGVFLEVRQLVGAGWIISNALPGNVWSEPGMSGFTRQADGFDYVWGTSMIGNLAWGVRGTHNVVIQLDHSGLAPRSQPGDPMLLAFDQDNDGVEEGWRKNTISVDYTTAGFTTRYDSYVDQQGVVTLPVNTAVVTGLTLRRMDNGLGVSFAVAGNATLCEFLFGAAEIIWGDVNGDGIVDDTDLAVVLTNFGASE